MSTLVSALILLILHTPLLYSKPLKVHILSGQSNMSGYGDYKSGAYQPNPKVDQQIPYFYHVDTKFGSRGSGGKSETIQTLDTYRIRENGRNTYSANTPHSNGRWGVELAFARTLSTESKDKHGIIKIAEGGTGLANRWDSQPAPDGSDRFSACWKMWVEQTTKALSLLKKEGYEVDIASIVWTQGENDTNNKTAAFAYEKNFLRLINAMYNHLNSLGYPTNETVFINNSFSHSKLARMIDQQEVRRAQKAVMNAIPNGFYHDNSELNEPKHYRDKVHYNGASLITMGENMALGYLEYKQKQAE